MQTESPTMAEWAFKPNTPADIALRVGVGGVFVTAIAQAAMQAARPTSATNFAVSLMLALLLALPFLQGKELESDRALRNFALVISGAFFWIALLYFFDWQKLVKVPQGYEPLTDVLSSLFFIVGWMILVPKELSKESRMAERTAILVVFATLGIAGASKFAAANGALVEATDQARLMLNFANGAILLGLYALMRRVLVVVPDPVTHVVILLFGCAQIAAHGRDCLSAAVPCTTSSFSGITALSIAWTLLLGKIAFGLYVVFCLHRAEGKDEPPHASGKTNEVATAPTE